jgi:hypothetical protein
MVCLNANDTSHSLLQALFTLYGFNYPLTVAFLQMAVIAPVCYAVARPKLEWGIARGTLPLAMVNVLNVVSGLIGEPITARIVSVLPLILQESICPQCLLCRGEMDTGE